MPGKIGILLSGLGYEDGTQILELPFIYREIERGGGIPLCLIPTDVTPAAGRGKRIQHRDFFEECKPIIRGEAIALEQIEARDLRALIIPGGKGAITTISDIEIAGSDGRIIRSLQDLIVGLHVRKKPIGTLGYGGALVIVALKRIENEPIITIGEDAVLTAALSALGVSQVNVGPQEVIYDPENRIFSNGGIAPGTSILKTSDGVERLVQGVLEYKAKKK